MRKCYYKNDVLETEGAEYEKVKLFKFMDTNPNTEVMTIFCERPWPFGTVHVIVRVKYVTIAHGLPAIVTAPDVSNDDPLMVRIVPTPPL